MKEAWCYRPLCIKLVAARSSAGPFLQQKQCPMCSFECPSIAILLSHLRLVHSNDPRFLVCCGINSCTVTSRSFSSLYTHIYRHHPGAGIKRLLKLKEQRRVSQVAINDIVEHSKAQFDRTVSILLAEVRSHLAERGVNPSELDLDSAISKLNHPFSEMDTKHKQDKYFREKLGLIVS